ncbi:MAG: hypothetical protein ACTSV1_02645 [Alphaproteobacteria bacterium]
MSRSVIGVHIVIFLLGFIFMFQDEQIRINELKAVAVSESGAARGSDEAILYAVDTLYRGYAERGDALRAAPYGGTQDLHDRHKLRWAYRTVEGELYKAVNDRAGPRAASYVRMVHYAVWMTATFLFSWLTLRRLVGGLGGREAVMLAVAFYAYLNFTSWSPLMRESYSWVEMGCVAVALYGAVSKRLLLFLVVQVIAVANRESAVVLGALYPILNWKRQTPIIPLIPLVFGPAVFIGFNLSVFSDPNFYKVSTYVGTETKYMTWFNLFGFPLKTIAIRLLMTVLAAAPFAAVLYYGCKTPDLRRLTLGGAIFIPVLLFGTTIGNIFPYTIIISFLLVLGGAICHRRGLL